MLEMNPAPPDNRDDPSITMLDQQPTGWVEKSLPSSAHTWGLHVLGDRSVVEALCADKDAGEVAGGKCWVHKFSNS